MITDVVLTIYHHYYRYTYLNDVFIIKKIYKNCFLFGCMHTSGVNKIDRHYTEKRCSISAAHFCQLNPYIFINTINAVN